MKASTPVTPDTVVLQAAAILVSLHKADAGYLASALCLDAAEISCWAAFFADDRPEGKSQVTLAIREGDALIEVIRTALPLSDVKPARACGHPSTSVDIVTIPDAIKARSADCSRPGDEK